MASSKEVVKTINHYKKSLEVPNVDEKRILHCIGVLFKLVVTVNVLQETGIGRTVNGLCKSESSEVRAAAKGLVNKWKALVVNESEDEPARHSQEEETDHVVEERKHHSSSSSSGHRKDAERIKKERDNRSHHHHHKSSSSSSGKDKEGEGSSKPHHQKSHHRERGERTESSSAVTNGSSSSASQLKPTGDNKHHHKETSSATSSSSNRNSSKKSSHSDRHREEKGDRKRSRDEKGEHKDRSSKRHRTEATAAPREEKEVKSEEEEEDAGIDGSAGTSFADALAMMDGGTPAKVSKSASSTAIRPSSRPTTSTASSASSSQSNKAKGTSSLNTSGSSRPHHSSTTTSSSSSKSNSTKAVAGSSRSSRVTDSGSGPPKLLAPSTKLAPLLDAEQLKKDILGPSVVISNSYTPSSYMSAAIQKNKRPGNTVNAQPSAPPVVDPNNFEILQSKARTKVYSGNKCASVVLSLHEMCIRVLQKNVDALEYTGGVPYDILEPILVKCSANQLDQIEYYNPYLAEDTNGLWEKHVLRNCRGKKRMEMESWREMYQRCQQEEQDRLSVLTESIKHSQSTSVPLKQTKMAFMDRQTPHQGRRRAPGGSGWGSGSSGPSINASLGDRKTVSGTRMGFLTAGREVQAKRAPLMQKTLALMKKAIKR